MHKGVLLPIVLIALFLLLISASVTGCREGTRLEAPASAPAAASALRTLLHEPQNCVLDAGTYRCTVEGWQVELRMSAATVPTSMVAGTMVVRVPDNVGLTGLHRYAEHDYNVVDVLTTDGETITSNILDLRGVCPGECQPIVGIPIEIE